MTSYPEEGPLEKGMYHITFNLGGEELYAECTTYDPTTDEFLTREREEVKEALGEYQL